MLLSLSSPLSLSLRCVARIVRRRLEKMGTHRAGGATSSQHDGKNCGAKAAHFVQACLSVNKSAALFQLLLDCAACCQEPRCFSLQKLCNSLAHLPHAPLLARITRNQLRSPRNSCLRNVNFLAHLSSSIPATCSAHNHFDSECRFSQFDTPPLLCFCSGSSRSTSEPPNVIFLRASPDI